MVRHTIETVSKLLSPVRMPTIVLIFFTTFSVHAAEFPQHYLTDVWTADDGLPDSSVTAIACDWSESIRASIGAYLTRSPLPRTLSGG